MVLFNIIISLCLLAEVTFLVYKNFNTTLPSNNRKRKVYVDTSALMDPRLLAVAQSGFIGDDLIIPRSVTNELQLLADGKDSEKRMRARAGLDTVRELERVIYFNTTIFNDELDRTPVDNRLIDLAKSNHGLILTNDFNLQKVAATEHIDVLNLNELALAIRNQYLPGEHAKVKVISEGSNPHQGVGYLPDGTMVVIDNASDKIGYELEVEFIRLNQTASGTMMFAKPLGADLQERVKKPSSNYLPKVISSKPTGSKLTSSKSTLSTSPKTTKSEATSSSFREPRKSHLNNHRSKLRK